MKPQSIRRFDLFYLGSIVLSIVGYVISYDAMVAQMEARTAAAGVPLGSGTVIATIVVGLAVDLLLWFLVSRKGLALAKWIIVALFLLALLSTLGLFGVPGLFSGAWTLLKTISALTLLAEAAAVFCLFQPDAKAWFAHEEPGAAADATPDLPAD
jgi:hypothetical protein